MAEPKRSWTYIPPAWSGTQVEGTSFLPIGRYRMPDGSEQVSFGLPQPMLDAVRGLGYASGRDQDPNAPAGYVSQNALMKGGQGLAESAMVGSLGARAPRGALRSGIARNADLDPSQAARMARAKEQGYADDVWYHQTAKENEPSLMEHGFDLSRGRARLTDEQVPDGVFMKPDERDINVGAYGADAVQIPLRTRVQNTAYFGDRAGMESHLSYLSPEYADAVRRARRFDRIMARRYDLREDRLKGLDDVEYGNRLDLLDDFISKWTSANERLAGDARKKATEALRKAGYDSVRFKDEGSGGRVTDSLVVLNPSDIRSVNAMFDPAKSDRANLLAANPLAGAIPLAWRQPQEDERPIY